MRQASRRPSTLLHDNLAESLARPRAVRAREAQILKQKICEFGDGPPGFRGGAAEAQREGLGYQKNGVAVDQVEPALGGAYARRGLV